ncbi:MAG: NUDIX hydrolase [Bacteroidota bacterium]
MYKIYINETPLFIIHETEINNWPKTTPTNLLARYPGKPKFLLNYIDMLEKSRRYEQVALYYEDIEQLWADFQTQFKLIEAAGGVVKNEKEEILFIFRRDNWDLPKGKIDPGETPEIAAVREVMEETGIDNIELGELVTITYHTYKLKSKQRILKRTYWYDMKAPGQELTPQTEEDIEQASWMTLDAFNREPRVVYKSIIEVLSSVEGRV